MSGISTYASMNLAEAMKREHYDDRAAVIGKIAYGNDPLQFLQFYPSSDPTYNRQLQQTRLASGSWGTVNAPLVSDTGATDIIDEPVKLYEGESKVDDRVLKLSKNPLQLRDSMDYEYLEGAMQELAYDIFYGSEATDPNCLRSFARRRASLGSFCISASGSGSDLTSAWVLEQGRSLLYIAYPENTGSAGLTDEDMGLQRVTAPTGTGDMYAWCRKYSFYGAIVVRNDRALVRYCNIETAGASNLFSVTDFVKLVLPSLAHMGRGSIMFVNRTLMGQISAVAYGDTKNGALTVRDIEGYGLVTHICNIPIFLHEGITNAETALT